MDKTKMSPGLVKALEISQKKDAVYSAEEKQSLFYYLDKLEKTKEQYTTGMREFDGLNYFDDYQLNSDGLNSYLRPKKNPDEVRVNTGLLEKKIEVVQNELQAMNLSTELHAFDEFDNDYEELGRDINDAVKRTNYIERDEDFWVDFIPEILSQRIAYFKETMVDRTVRDPRGRKSSFRIYRAEKRAIPGNQVFLGDLGIPLYLMDTQPYIFEYNRISYEEGNVRFGNESFWDKVRPGMPQDEAFYGGLFNYRFGRLGSEDIEIISFYDANNNEWQDIVQGVMRFEPGHELPWKHEGYNIKGIGLKPMRRNFAPCKPLTASAKTLQSFSNETLRMLIRKFRQALEPPLGVRNGKVYNRSIFSPGKVTQGLSGDSFSRIVDHNGITQSEFAFYDLIERKAEEFIGVGNIMQGISSKGDITATEALAQQKQAIINLGHAVLAVMRAKREANNLRVYSLLENYNSPIDSYKDPVTKQVTEIYARFTQKDAELENGVNGTKVIHFTNRDLNDEEEQQVKNQEDMMAKKGKNVRYKYINKKKLEDVRMLWYTTVNQQERDGSALQRAMYSDKITQGHNIEMLTGRKMKADKLVQGFERTWQDFGLFEEAPPQQSMGGPQSAATPDQGQGEDVSAEAKDLLGSIDELKGKSAVGAQATKGVTAKVQQPSLNTITQQ